MTDSESSDVLLIEDTPSMARVYLEYLKRGPFRARHCMTGQEALADIAHNPTDAVLLDLRLPDMDGREVARALRDGVRTRLIPVVALTALRFGGDHDALSADGFAGCLEKPIDVRAFPDQVRSYCRR